MFFLGTKMKCFALGFLFFEIAAGFTYVSPSGQRLDALTVLGNLIWGQELKDFPNCGRPREILDDGGSVPASSQGAQWQDLFCSPDAPCSFSQGDCDSDDECAGSLKCGSDNCNQPQHNSWRFDADCCAKG